jgi:hypothetical protein
MTEKVIVPADVQLKLAQANGNAVPLCDEAGTVIGYYVSSDRLASIEAERKAAYGAFGALATEEELDAAERDGGSHTMEEVFKLLEQP